MTETLATRLRTIRESQHLTVDDLADASGVARSTLYNLECGRLRAGVTVYPSPTLAVLDAICGALGVGRDDLVGKLGES